MAANVSMMRMPSPNTAAVMKLFAILFSWISACLLPSHAVQAQQEPIVIRFSHVVAADTPKGKAAVRFKQLAEEATNGRVRVQVYPNSELYRDREELEALQLGAVEMIAPSLSKFGPLGVREFEVFDLPFIDRKSTRLNSSHVKISYAVFCLKKKKKK